MTESKAELEEKLRRALARKDQLRSLGVPGESSSMAQIIEWDELNDKIKTLKIQLEVKELLAEVRAEPKEPDEPAAPAAPAGQVDPSGQDEGSQVSSNVSTYIDPNATTEGPSGSSNVTQEVEEITTAKVTKSTSEETIKQRELASPSSPQEPLDEVADPGEQDPGQLAIPGPSGQQQPTAAAPEKVKETVSHRTRTTEERELTKSKKSTVTTGSSQAPSKSGAKQAHHKGLKPGVSPSFAKRNRERASKMPARPDTPERDPEDSGDEGEEGAEGAEEPKGEKSKGSEKSSARPAKKRKSTAGQPESEGSAKKRRKSKVPEEPLKVVEESSSEEGTSMKVLETPDAYKKALQTVRIGSGEAKRSHKPLDDVVSSLREYSDWYEEYPLHEDLEALTKEVKKVDVSGMTTNDKWDTLVGELWKQILNGMTCSTTAD